MAPLAEGRADDHALGRLVRQEDAPLDGAAAGEALHPEDEQPALTRVAESQLVALAGHRNVARARALGHFPAAHREGAHRRERLLPVVLEVEEGDGVHAHVAVVRHGQRDRAAAVVDEVVVPFLDAVGRGLHVRAAVDRQQTFRKAGLGYVAAAVEQGPRPGYLMLSHMPRSFRCSRMSRPWKVSRRYSPSKRDIICGPYLRSSSSIVQFVLIMVGLALFSLVFMS